MVFADRREGDLTEVRFHTGVPGAGDGSHLAR